MNIESNDWYIYKEILNIKEAFNCKFGSDIWFICFKANIEIGHLLCDRVDAQCTLQQSDPDPPQLVKLT